MRIVISGTIGVGKSTISNMLYKYLEQNQKDKNVFLIEELQKDNPYLDFFYKNRPEWSFLIQIDFLFERFKNVMHEEEKMNNNRIVIFDRHFLDDFVFANSNSLKEDISYMQINMYKFINQTLSFKIPDENKPDFLFLLKADFNIIIDRVKSRGRDFEQDDELLDYWKDVYYNYYENSTIMKYFKENAKRVIVIDSNGDELLTFKKIVDHINKKESKFFKSNLINQQIDYID